MDITIQSKKQIVDDTFEVIMECFKEGHFLDIEGLLYQLIDSNSQNAELIRKWTYENE